MKKILLSVFALSMFVAVKAQEIPERKAEKPKMMERKKHHRHGMDFKKLNLSEEQKAQFKTQNESFKQKMSDLKKNEDITVREWKARAEALRKDHKANVDKIFTAEQKAQMEQMKVDRKAKADAMHKKRGEMMKTRLGLTDEQAAKMESNRKAMGEQMIAIRGNKSLSEEQKKEQMKELHKKQKENMKSILTEEQLQKLKENKQRKPGMEKKKADVKETI